MDKRIMGLSGGSAFGSISIFMAYNSNRVQKEWVRKEEAEMDGVYCTIVRVFKYTKH
jgi:hypothetical protein